MATWTLSQTLTNIRERGLENTFQRFYSFYQSRVKSTADPQQQGRSRVHVDSLGYPREHPEFADTMSPFASDDAGFYFPPYEDDLVYVSFDQGDHSSPMVVGSFWKTRGNRQVSDSGVPAEFVRSDESAPTVRGIKVRVGSGLAFDETEDQVKTEMWTGASQGVGQPAEKHHRVLLDDTTEDEKVVVASFGGHESRWQDKAGEVYLRHKTTDGHEVLLDDTGKKILIKSVGDHAITIDDNANTIEAATQSGSRIFIDGAANDITLETPGQNSVLISDSQMKIEALTTGQRKLALDDALQVIRAESPGGVQVVQVSPLTGTQITDNTAGGVTTLASAGPLISTGQGTAITSAGGAPATINNTGTATSTFQGLMTEDLLGAQTKNVTGTWNVLGGFIGVINALSLALGTGLQLRLVNENFFAAAYNVHTHTTTIAGAPTGPPITGLGVVGTHTTTQVTGS